MYPSVLLFALASALPAAAHADGNARMEAAGHGAIAGRSPHLAYRPLVPLSTCGKSKQSLPAGKLPVFGHAVAPNMDCATHAHGVADALPTSMRGPG